MDFFARQEQSRRATRWLVVLFGLAVILIVSAVTLLVGILLTVSGAPQGAGVIDSTALGSWLRANGPLLTGVATVTASLIFLTSLYRIATLSRGGGQVARMLGGTQVTGENQDPLRRRLTNVVEEMAIASGVPVPEIYVLEEEQAINAFAAGLTARNAAVAVTRGALERLERAELQGVVAHEFSHILNGDMRLNLRLMGLSFGILVLSILGRWLLKSARHGRRATRNRGVAFALVLGLGLTLIGSIGLFFGRLIKAGVSRQRETLADASAVQFTRDPTGLAGALKKIGGYTGQLSSRDSEEIAHMLFSRGSSAFRGWFATHPPLDARIRALDPTFAPGDYAPAEPLAAVGVETDAEVLVRALAEGEGSVDESSILDSTGEVAPQRLATALKVAIPEELHHAAQSTDASLLLVLALALGEEGPVRERQVGFLAQQLGGARAARCRRLAEDLTRMDQRLKLPLLELAGPALKLRPAEQLDYLSETLEKLTELNPRVRLFDYVLLRMLESFLPEWTGRSPRRPKRLRAGAALVIVLRCVASYGHESPIDARGAFEAGMAAIGARTGRVTPASFEPAGDARDLRALDDALARLDALRPRAKERVLAAILACVRHDGHIGVAELELYRAIAATLACPVPPAAAVTPSE